MSCYLQCLLGQKKNKEQETRGKNEKSVGIHWSFEKFLASSTPTYAIDSCALYFLLIIISVVTAFSEA